MSSRDRRARPAIDESTTSEGSVVDLPAELRAELRRLLAAILVADVREYPTMPQEVGKAVGNTLCAEKSK